MANESNKRKNEDPPEDNAEKRARVEKNEAVDTEASGVAQSHEIYQRQIKRIEIASRRASTIIGNQGATVKFIQHKSGTTVQVFSATDEDPTPTKKGVVIIGTPDQIAKAEQMIYDIISEFETGGYRSRCSNGQPPGTKQVVFKTTNDEVLPPHMPPADKPKERTVQINEASGQIEAARQLDEEAIREQPGYRYVQADGMNEPPYPPQSTYNSGQSNQHGALGGGYSQWAPLQQQQQQAHWAPTDGFNQALASNQGQGQGQGYAQQQGYSYASSQAASSSQQAPYGSFEAQNPAQK